MNNELISIIVPVYNVEQYLSKCIESILKQTYSNIEIILIDDGSTDLCRKICDEYKQKDSRIVVIHKTNGGLSSARNYGLDIANGAFICFIDSDDYIEPNMIECLKKNMEKFDSDISACSFYKEKNGSSKVQTKNFTNLEFVATENDIILNLANQYSSLMAYAWNKLYKREIFDEIRFPKGKIYEYSYVLCDILEKVTKISYILEPLYHYVYRSSSLGHSFNLSHFDIIDSFDKKINFFEKKGFFDLAKRVKNNKVLEITKRLAKMKYYKIKDITLFEKYYQEAVNTANELTWNESKKKTKLFKLFKKCYVEVVYLEYMAYFMIQKVKDKKIN